MPAPVSETWISNKEYEKILSNRLSPIQSSFLGYGLCCWLIMPSPISLVGKCTIAALMTFASHLFLDQPNSNLLEAAKRLHDLPEDQNPDSSDIVTILRYRYGSYIAKLRDSQVLENLNGEAIIPPKALASDRMRTLPLESACLYIISLIGALFIVGPMVLLLLPQLPIEPTGWALGYSCISLTLIFTIIQIAKAIQDLQREGNKPLDFETMCEVYSIVPQ